MKIKLKTSFQINIFMTFEQIYRNAMSKSCYSPKYII